MGKIDLSQIGNTSSYKPRARNVQPASQVVASRATVKFYVMLAENTPNPTQEQIESARTLAAYKLENQLNVHSGLGFAVLSEDILNISLWGRDVPSVIHPNLYQFQNIAALPEISPRILRRSSSDKLGAFCIYEAGILEQERVFWRRFLESKRKDSDKQRYLEHHAFGPIN